MLKEDEIKKNIEIIVSNVKRLNNDAVILGVSKMTDAKSVIAARKAGITQFGESKIQEALSKIKEVNESTEGIRWHFIGHLQTNKVNKAVENFEMIQSVDSLRLAEKIASSSVKKEKKTKILLELKISEEESKFGIIPEKAAALAEAAAKLPQVIVKGIMTMAPYTEEPENSRKYFRQARKMFEEMKKNDTLKNSMEIISMGMTNDYIAALEEGSTMVRIGTGIFGERQY